MSGHIDPNTAALSLSAFARHASDTLRCALRWQVMMQVNPDNVVAQMQGAVKRSNKRNPLTVMVAKSILRDQSPASIAEVEAKIEADRRYSARVRIESELYDAIRERLGIPEVGDGDDEDRERAMALREILTAIMDTYIGKRRTPRRSKANLQAAFAAFLAGREEAACDLLREGARPSAHPDGVVCLDDYRPGGKLS